LFQSFQSSNMLINIRLEFINSIITLTGSAQCTPSFATAVIVSTSNYALAPYCKGIPWAKFQKTIFEKLPGA
ncbi:hypothetical protein T12_1841, partial [Trichinella patagoniensis]